MVGNPQPSPSAPTTAAAGADSAPIISNLLSICTSKEAADTAAAEAQCIAKERKHAHDAALACLIGRRGGCRCPQHSGSCPLPCRQGEGGRRGCHHPARALWLQSGPPHRTNGSPRHHAPSGGHLPPEAPRPGGCRLQHQESRPDRPRRRLR